MGSRKVISNADEPAAWIIVSFMTAVPLWVFSITIEDNQLSPVRILRESPFDLNAELEENTYSARGWSLVSCQNQKRLDLTQLLSVPGVDKFDGFVHIINPNDW